MAAGISLSPVPSRPKTSLHPTYFGLKLSRPTLVLWNEVSAGYGKPIREETNPSEIGFSIVDRTGTPVITLSEPAEDYSVHELMHLKLFLEGFPVGIGWHDDCPLPAHVRAFEYFRVRTLPISKSWLRV